MKQVKHTYIVKMDGSKDQLFIQREVVMYETYGGIFYIDIGHIQLVTSELAQKLLA